MNDPLNDTQKAAREQFSKQSHLYGTGHILEDVQDIAEAMESVELSKGSKVLDVATGGGHTGIYFASLGHEVTLADLAAPMLERAEEAAKKRGLQVKTREHAAEKFPYEDACFDVVTCRLAAHHFSSPSQFVSEASRVLRPGGVFLLIDGTVEDNQPEAEDWLHQVEKLRDPSHSRFLTPKEWKWLCVNNGFSVRSCKITPFKQPDIQWYFETAATPPENRVKVLELVGTVPDSARQLFQVGEESGRIVWWWQRLSLVAIKNTPSTAE